jgi:hypothetical protein
MLATVGMISWFSRKVGGSTPTTSNWFFVSPVPGTPKLLNRIVLPTIPGSPPNARFQKP